MLFSPPPDASWIEPLPDGHQGTIRTLEAMRFLCRKDYLSPFVTACVWGIQDFGSQRDRKSVV